MVCGSRGLHAVLSGHTCQERLRYSREENPSVFCSSPDVLWKTHSMNTSSSTPAPQNASNTSRPWRVVEEELWLQRPDPPPSPSHPGAQRSRHPAELHSKATPEGQRSKDAKCPKRRQVFHWHQASIRSSSELRKNLQSNSVHVWNFYCHRENQKCKWWQSKA